MSPEQAVSRALHAVAPDSTIVAAVSGGADSIALLHLMARSPAGRDSGVRLVAAHLDHGLRGSASEDDARFVRRIARDLEIPCVIGRVDLARAARGSLEARARRARYRFLLEAARRRGAGCVFTAHTLEDQAETTLDRLLRGTGIRGLRGILPDRRLGSDGTVRLRRPLLDVRRADLRSWLEVRELSWREDPTNHDGSNRRSRIRQELLPRVEAIGPAGAAGLARLARRARETWALVLRETRRHERRAIRDDPDGLRLCRRAFRRAPEAVRWPLLARWLARNGQKPRGLGEVAIREAIRIAMDAPAGTRFERPGHVGFEVSRRSLCPRRRP